MTKLFFSKYVSNIFWCCILRVMDQEYFVRYHCQHSLEKWEISGQTCLAECRSQLLTSICHLWNRREGVLGIWRNGKEISIFSGKFVMLPLFSFIFLSSLTSIWNQKPLEKNSFSHWQSALITIIARVPPANQAVDSDTDAGNADVSQSNRLQSSCKKLSAHNGQQTATWLIHICSTCPKE